MIKIPGVKRKTNVADTRRLVRALYRGMLRRRPDEQEVAHWTREITQGLSPGAVAEKFLESDEFRRSRKAAKLFVPPGHFYSPIVDREEARRHLAEVEALGIPESLPGVAIDRSEMVRTWNDLAPFLKSAPFGQAPSAELRYGYENPHYSWGDGSVLHAMLRLHRPKRLIEIGSGWSSACTLDTVERYLDGACELTFIEPYPQLLRDLIKEVEARVRVIESPIQTVPLETFDRLERGDFLFIDSTHVLRTGSDVCRELFEILPRLAPGVFVHIHDMFWPFEYPREWVVKQNRSWNELYAVRAFLTNNRAWKVVMFNDYMTKLELPLIQSTFPLFLNNSGAALWLQHVGE